VALLSPKMWIQVGEEPNNFWMPRPPKVLSQCAKPIMKMVGRNCHYTLLYFDQMAKLLLETESK
jgi:hypothetical protein